MRLLRFLCAATAMLASTASLAAPLDPNAFPSLGVLNVPAGSLTINTNNLTISGSASFGGISRQQEDGPSVAIFTFDHINLGPSTSVTIVGDRPLALLSKGAATIQSTLNLSATAPFSGETRPGPGGYSGGLVYGASPPHGAAGAGPGGGSSYGVYSLGGSFGGGGGYVQNSSTVYIPGAAPYGGLLSTLEGGSGGAIFSYASGYSSGGAGGGAIEIGAVGNLVVGQINALGSQPNSTGGPYHGGGGGGGGILLHSEGSLTTLANLIARGGGGAAGSGGGGGRVALLGLSSFTLGGSAPASVDLTGGASGGSGYAPGYAGVLTVRANSTVVPTGVAMVLDGNPVLSTPGSISTSNPTIEAVIERNLTISAGGTVTLGKSEPLQSNAFLAVNGTLNTGTYSQTVGDLTGSGTINLNEGGSLSFSAGSFSGIITGPGVLRKISGSAASFSGSINSAEIDVEDEWEPFEITGVMNPIGDFLKTGPGFLEIAGDLTPASGTAGIHIAEGTLSVAPTGSISAGAKLSVDSGATFSVVGSTVSRPIDAAAGSRVVVSNADLGSGGVNSVRIRGDLELAGTTTFHSTGFVTLGERTSLAGTLNAIDGVSLGVGATLFGNGIVNGKTASSAGSLIAAEGGNLTIGSATTPAGFFSDGDLSSGPNTVTINDANEAVLGSLTTLGDGVNGGTLVAGTAMPLETRTHFLIEQGKNLVGRGHVVGNVKNHGSVIGDGPSLLPNERVIFDAGWKVSGIGDFANVLFNGTFAPGLSPGVVAGSDLAIGGTLEIELGGATPGNGVGHHDQVNDASVFTVTAGAALALQSYGGFLPELGEQFTIVTAAAGFAGEFASMTVDPWFRQHGIDFQLSTTSSALVITAVAPHLSGDFNQDGSVDASDYIVWRQGLGTTYSQAELADWRTNFGRSFSAGTTFDNSAVPEPGVLATALFAITAFATQRRRIGGEA